MNEFHKKTPISTLMLVYITKFQSYFHLPDQQYLVLKPPEAKSWLVQKLTKVLEPTFVMIFPYTFLCVRIKIHHFLLEAQLLGSCTSYERWEYLIWMRRDPWVQLYYWEL
jgi:hypothetical protein